MFLSFIGAKYDIIEPTSLNPAGAELLAVNDRGMVPVLEDGSNVIRDSNAILIYLAIKNNQMLWYPVNDALKAAKVTEWMSYAVNEVNTSLLFVRISNKFSWNIPISYDAAIAKSNTVLSYLNNYLNNKTWLVDDSHPTIADIAVFPYVALAESSSSDAIQLSEYPNVVAWINRVKSLPNMTAMPPW